MDSVVSKRREAERQERIDRILSAAKKVFVEKGYMRTTVRGIAKEAELSTGAVYYYFKGKDEIYFKVCEEAYKINIKLLKEAVDIDADPITRLMRLAEVHLRFYKEYPEYFEIITFLNTALKDMSFSKELHRRLIELSHRTLTFSNEVVTEIIKEGSIPEEFASSWEITMVSWASLEGLIEVDKRGHLERYGLDLEKLLRLLGHLIFEALRANSK